MYINQVPSWDGVALREVDATVAPNDVDAMLPVECEARIDAHGSGKAAAGVDATVAADADAMPVVVDARTDAQGPGEAVAEYHDGVGVDAMLLVEVDRIDAHGSGETLAEYRDHDGVEGSEGRVA